MGEGVAPDDRLSVETLMQAYRSGRFPMALSGSDDRVEWHTGVPTRHGVLRAFLPLESLHIAASLRKVLRKAPYRIGLDADFDAVIRACALMPRPGGEGTWINAAIEEGFIALHRAGLAHCVACYDGSGALVGGVYGVRVGRIFCGESLFSAAPEAGKIALVGLAAALWRAGFAFLEIQQVTAFTQRFGACWIPLAEYLILLAQWRDSARPFGAGGPDVQSTVLAYLAFLRSGERALAGSVD